MSAQIDERIVEMRFENSKFEKNVSETMKSIDELKKKLAFKNAGDGFDDLQKKANKVSFEHLVKSVDNLQSVVLHRTGIMGGAFEEIGAKIVNVFTNALGKVQKMINQVTFDPISTGLSEYELKINSVQVIAANTGVLMRDAMKGFEKSTNKANDAIDELYETAIYGAEHYNSALDDSSTITGELFKSASIAADDFQAALDVMMGNYGNGQQRKDLLGDRYADIQDTVNMLIAETGSVEGAIRELESAGYTAAGLLYSYDEAGNLVANTMDVFTDSIDGVTDAFDDLNDSAEYTMKDIEKVLDDLNLYADKTIYNYAQMTDAIGQFTVQGVDLYDANTAVQGLANLAAFTGVDAASTARVMREAAKGLATGFIGLQDWMSFETTGGMGGKVFQEQLMATADQLLKTDAAYQQYARDAGFIDEQTTSIEQLVKASGKFRNSLKEGWLNDKVLVETLHKFAGDLTDAEWAARGYTEAEIADIQALGEVAFEAATKAKTFTQMWDAVTEAAQSSWTTTWEYIFGTFYDARNLWTSISDALSEIIGDFNESRNAALKFWAKSPFGRKNFLKGMANAWTFLRNVFYSVKNAWGDVMGTIDGKKLVEWSVAFRKMTESLNTEKSQKHVKNLVNVLTVFFSILKVGLNIVTAAAKLAGKTISVAFGLIPIDIIEAVTRLLATIFSSIATMKISPDNILNDIANIFIVLKESLTDLDFLPLTVVIDLISLLGKVVAGVGIVIGTVFQALLGLFGVSIDQNTVTDILLTADAFIKLADSMLVLENIPGLVITAMTKLFTFIKNIPIYIAVAVVAANEMVKEFTGIDILGIFTTIFNNIKTIIANAADLISDFMVRFNEAETIGDKIKVVLSVIGGVFKDLFSGVGTFLGPGFDKIKEYVESLVNKNNLQRLTQLAVLAARLYLLVKVITSTKALTYIAEGIKKFIDALTEGATGTFDAATKAFKTLQKNANAQLIFSIAAALLALAVAVWVISRVPSDKMQDVLTALTLIFGGMLALLGSLKKMLGVVPEAAAASIGGVLTGISFMLLALALSVKILSGVSEYDLIKAILAIVAVIGALSILVKAFAHTKRAKYAVGVAVGVNLLIGAIFPLIAALGWLMLLLEHEQYEGEMATALVVLGVLALFIIGMVEFLSLAADTITTGPGVAALLVVGGTLILVSVAILIMVGALFLIMKEIEWANQSGQKDIGNNAMLTLAAMLAMITAFLMVVMGMSSSLTPAAVAGLFVVGGTLIALEVAIVAMVGILYLIMKIMNKATREGEVGEALGVLLGIIFMLIAVTAVTMAMSTFLKPSSVAGLFVLGGAMIAMAAAVLIIVIALQKLMEIDRDGADYANAVLSLGKIIAAVVLIAAILGILFGNAKFLSNNRFGFSFNPRITGGTGFSKVGTLLAGIGISILAVIAALWIVIDAFAKLIDLSNKWDAENGREKLTQAIVGICGAFTDAYPQIKESGSKLNEMVMDFVKTLINDLVVTLEYLLMGLAEVAYDLAETLVNILIAILNGLGGTDLSSGWDGVFKGEFTVESMAEAFMATAEDAPINKLVNAIVALIALVIYGVGDAIVNNSGPLAVAVLHLLTSIGYLILYVVMFIGGLLASQFGDFDFSYVEGFMNDWDNLWQNWWIETHEFWENWENVVPSWMSTAASVLWGALLNIASPVVSFIDFLAQAWYSAEHMFDDPFLTNYQSPKWIEDFRNLYFTVAESSPFYKNAAGLNDLSDSAGETVEILTDVADTIDSMSGKTVDITMTPQLAVDPDKFSIPMFDALNKAGEESKKGFKDAWDIHSPSGVGEEYGENIAEGQTIGYANFMNSDKAKEYMESAKQKFGAMMGNIDISSMMGLDGAEIDLNPQQIFNLDTENLGGNLMNGEFGETFSGMGLNMGDVSATISDMGLNIGGMSTDLADVSNYNQELSDALAAEGDKFYDDSDLISELGSLREDIWALSDAMSKIKMQLDTGKLVGEMVAPMDAALAQRATRASRGN